MTDQPDSIATAWAETDEDGRVMISVMMPCEVNLPGHPDIGVIMQQVATEFEPRLRNASEAQRHDLMHDMAVASNSRVATAITDYRDLVDRAKQKAVDALPDRTFAAFDAMVKKFQQGGYTVLIKKGDRQ